MAPHFAALPDREEVTTLPPRGAEPEILLDGSRDEESTRLAISSESRSLPLDKVDTSWQTK